ncbi:5-methyltetrahydropteroyltriglutamate--homocysteine S-methyltransferase [Candidatus Deianiraea vastatrix]|uniref:5-methyltetrahydropteroyltriglutamate--homocysteine S-methyltransferase n=1 Tax=Candidatus Deianiraea vastatrix TaxID=2163644 RepID=A0A5B8XEU7_9RICK|nr:5-methyltetrahydropteroyltriglutamate--homocysteine S-methyltransferase [Candidatus Deianiraea vastatrix]QED23496.1 Cobalamin-independent homocysteine transmethylase [Candidatus Deianiraea vastatrix]
MTHSVQSACIGFPRVGKNRELKFALESFWQGKISRKELEDVAISIRKNNWELQKSFDFIASCDFSYYDHVLDLSFEFSNIPAKFNVVEDDFERYFAVARGYQKNGHDLHACELSKWFNTNYHYIIPEFHSDVKPNYKPRKFVSQFLEAKNLGINTRPVIIGPVSYLLLGKEKTITRAEIFENILTCYEALILDLKANGATDIQIDEPYLATELDAEVKKLYTDAYNRLSKLGVKIHLVTYFDELAENSELAFSLPVYSIHLDLSEFSIPSLPKTDKVISLGLISGRNIWKNNLEKSFDIAKKILEENSIIIATSCSLLHTPYSVESEQKLEEKIKNRLAFAKEKLIEIKVLTDHLKNNTKPEKFAINVEKNEAVWQRLKDLNGNYERASVFADRKKAQECLNIPLFPTTTIGSFPQDAAIRKNRSDFKKGLKTQAEYDKFCQDVIRDCIKRQEDLDIDVLVHGECERNDMVEYFGENLEGFCFTENGWVQSYGSRCVKPPVIHSDVSRRNAITVKWAEFAQSCSKKHVKGMLTGPVTILKWSFVRDDIHQKITCQQIALALLDEVLDLEKAGIAIIQIDEPAIREILPIRRKKWNEVLTWAVDCFKISAYKVANTTQIHTHVCYSEFNDIIDHIVKLDADVLSIEASRSDLEVLSALKDGGYKNDIGPGVWDIHSPRVPSYAEMSDIIEKSLKVLKPEQIWVNPDCGLKTRGWDEVTKSLSSLVAVAKDFRKKH